MTGRGRFAALAGGVVVLAACAAGPPAATGGPEAARLPWPVGLPVADPVSCPEPTVQVSTADQLRAALAAVAPGAVIGLADGEYAGEFEASTTGTAEAPVWLCGSARAVLRGPGPDDGVVLALARVAHWRIVGITVREGRKGVMADGVTSSVLQDLTVTEIGDEAVHLRSGSTDNVVRGLAISGTGLRRVKFGEGIYVGTAESNWCDVSGCEPDRSDRNVIVDNDIRGTTAEPVDIKEGTTGGVVADNTLDGAGLRGQADSWVDVKGNGWLVQGNRGTSARDSGFEVNEQVDGWGTGNTFDANVADVRGSGFGFELRPVADNRVTCTNTVFEADKGLANVACR